jgi:subtilisin family serine protease
MKMVNAPNSLEYNLEKSDKIVVAIIDTGIDFSHKDLENSAWTDGNGTHGWDFVNNKSDAFDNIGHGTHVAGIIKNISPNTIFMNLKYYDLKNNSANNFSKALRYAIDKNADIINYSGGGRGFSVKEYQLLQEAEEKGIVVVVAAGNNNTNNDKIPFYPASYKLSNIISVAAVDKNANLYNSNYGRESVDIAAPGYKINSTFINNKYKNISGTSQATAFVTGAVAYLKSLDKNLSPLEIKQRLILTSNHKENLKDKILSEGVLKIKEPIQLVLNK